MPFGALPWWGRAARAAGNSVLALGLPCLLLVAVALVGGRYQHGRGGTEVDVGALSVLYPLGIALAGAIAGVGAPRVRRAWQAGLLGLAAALPAMSLIASTFDPRDPGASRGRVIAALVGALASGPAVGVNLFRHDRRERESGSRTRGAAKRGRVSRAR